MARPSTASAPQSTPTITELSAAAAIFGLRGRLWINRDIRVYVSITMLPEDDSADFFREFFGGSINHVGRYRRWLVAGEQMCSFLNVIAPYIRNDSAKRLARKALLHEAIMNEEENVEVIRGSLPLGVLLPAEPATTPEQRFENVFHLLSGDFDQMDTLRLYLETPLEDGGLSSIACDAGNGDVLNSWTSQVQLPPPAGLADVCTIRRSESFLILDRLPALSL